MEEVYREYREVLSELGLVDRLARLETHRDHRCTVESLTEQVSRAGFADIETETFAFTMRFVDGAALLRHWFIRMAFLPAWLDVVGETDALPVLRRLEARLNERAKKEGELALTVPGAILSARRPRLAQVAGLTRIDTGKA